jgi:very-short-patch-repair endonuclease
MPRTLKPRTETARRLRRESTVGEKLLWAQLKNRQLRGCKFVRQEPIGPYFADFVCRESKLVVEVDGDTHSTGEEIAHDTRRSAYLEQHGYRVIRFWNTEVKEGMDGVLAGISAAIESE